jgi:sigma-B regulation protein RsbU (phosphoserine phosphatase)
LQTATADALRHQLEERRARLKGGIATTGPEDELVRLLQQVDSALDKLGSDDFARCLVCHEHVAEQDLLENPLLHYCLCDLTPVQQRALEHDLELARQIQAALLPDPDLLTREWEAYYRYEPAGMVSGDYCDLWMRPDDPGTVFFAVGDVSGKGVAASLLMAHLQAAFRSLLGAGLPLAELVERINRQLLQATLPSHYATLACGRASDDGQIEIVNAGHCPPLVARSGSVEAVASTGLPIGVLGGRPYDVFHSRLGEGDMLVLYSDGLTEARRPDGEEYGQRRIETLLARRAKGIAPRELVHALRGDLAGFLDGGSRTDDLTLLMLSRSDGNGRV